MSDFKERIAAKVTELALSDQAAPDFTTLVCDQLKADLAEIKAAVEVEATLSGKPVRSPTLRAALEASFDAAEVVGTCGAPVRWVSTTGLDPLAQGARQLPVYSLGPCNRVKGHNGSCEPTAERRLAYYTERALEEPK